MDARRFKFLANHLTSSPLGPPGRAPRTRIRAECGVQSSMLGPGASPGNGWAGARPVGSAAGVIRRRGRMSEAPAEFQVYKRARAFGARRECAFRKTGPIL